MNDGNSASPIFSVPFTYSSAPAIASSIPADNATGIAAGSTIALTFSEAVSAVTGNVKIVNDTDNSTETIDVASDGGKFAWSNSNKTLTITPGTVLAGGKSYHVEVDATAFKNVNNVVFAGIANATTLNFTMLGAPGFSGLAPASNGFLKSSSSVGYTLSEPATSGSLTFTRTGGTADAGSPHTCTLQGTVLSAAAATVPLTTAANGCTTNINLTDGAVYTLAYAATNAVGNSAATSVTGITYDMTAPAAHATTPIAISDADSSHSYTANDTLTLQFSEPVATISVTLGNLTVSGGHSLGTGATVVAQAASGGFAQSYLVTLGSSPTVVTADTLTIAAANVSDRIANLASGNVVFTLPSDNTTPTFVGSTTTLTVAQGAPATDIKPLLHVSDSDASQTETWTQSAAPSHGTLSFASATATSGNADITPGGTIAYTPTSSYVGADSFTVQVSDGAATATRVINVSVGSARTVTVNALALNSMTAGTPFVSQSFTGVGGYSSYTYSVIAGTLPAGLALGAGGALTGTPSTSGAYNFTVQAVDSSTGSGPYSGTLVLSGTVAAPVIPPTKPIPTVIPPPPVAGVGSNPLSPLNLSSGDGPAMTTCLRDQLRTVIGANAVYQGQTADGGARIGATGLIVSFYALEASTSTSNGLGQGAGIYLRGSNPLNVVTSCGTFTTTPAVYNLSEWGAFLSGMGLAAQFNAQGVMTVVVGGTTYVARPDYSVTQVDPGTLTGTPRLVTGSDGLMRFTDSAGNVQILYPAFIDPETLVNQVAQAVGGYAVIQTDGTALVTLWNGQKFVLIPDMTLGTVPPEQLGAGWWQDGPDHYRYRNTSFSPTSQGFTVKPL